MLKLRSAFLKRASLLCLLVILFAANSNLFAQNAIQLTNNDNGAKSKPIMVGSKVTYALKPVTGQSLPKSVTGILSEVSATTATVNGVTINFSDLERFGARNPKAFMGFAALTGGGLALIRIATAEPQKIPVNCAGCQPVSVGNEKSNGGKAALIGLGAGLNVLGFYTFFKNPAKDLNKFSLEAVDI